MDKKEAFDRGAPRAPMTASATAGGTVSRGPDQVFVFQVSEALAEAERDARLLVPVATAEWSEENPVVRGGATIWLETANNSNLRRALMAISADPRARARVKVTPAGQNRVALDFVGVETPPDRSRIRNSALQAACDALRRRLGVTCYTVYQHRGSQNR
jgi:hypothetical protein